jgi:3-oxoacyl-[acyl-carrier protein] reductase
MRLDGKVVIVTGGASGIGASVCDRFSSEGGTVIVVDRDGDGAARKAASLKRATSICLDVSVVEQVDAAVNQVVADFGRLDALIHVAGIDDVDTKRSLAEHFAAGTPLDITSRLTDEQWRRMMSVNLDGTFYFLRAALRVMLAQQSGSIVNVASLAGVTSQAGLPHYSAAKAGVLGLTRAVAKEVADRGVRVNAIAPGAIDTPMLGRSPAALVSAIPMKRLGLPEEIASIALFLATDESAYITGETINVNGGMLTV